MAKETWAHDSGTPMNTDEILKLITAPADTEGVTFLGGEPFEQAQALAVLAEQVQSVGLSVVVFTGFTHDELLSLDNPHVQRLLNSTDLLIDGAFVEEKYDLSRPWVGSSNQRYRFLSERYSESDLAGVRNQIEVRIAPDGKTLINGMGDFSKIQKLMEEQYDKENLFQE
jgi:anaerobic ribonucleoside-triphosphate reductase activating protein